MVVATVSVGCAVSTDGTGEDLGSTHEAILGTLTVVNGDRTCVTGEVTKLTEGITLGRKTARSSAYLQCLADSSTTAMVIERSR